MREFSPNPEGRPDFGVERFNNYKPTPEETIGLGVPFEHAVQQGFERYGDFAMSLGPASFIDMGVDMRPKAEVIVYIAHMDYVNMPGMPETDHVSIEAKLTFVTAQETLSNKTDYIYVPGPEDALYRRAQTANLDAPQPGDIPARLADEIVADLIAQAATGEAVAPLFKEIERPHPIGREEAEYVTGLIQEAELRVPGFMGLGRIIRGRERSVVQPTKDDARRAGDMYLKNIQRGSVLHEYEEPHVVQDKGFTLTVNVKEFSVAQTPPQVEVSLARAATPAEIENFSRSGHAAYLKERFQDDTPLASIKNTFIYSIAQDGELAYIAIPVAVSAAGNDVGLGPRPRHYRADVADAMALHRFLHNPTIV